MKKQLRLLLCCFGFILVVSACEKSQLLDAHFTVVQQVGQLKVVFTNTTLGTKSTPLTQIKSSWSFGDNSVDTSTSPTHTYAAAGTYTVTLTV